MAFQIGSTGIDHVQALASDPAGNLTAAGYFAASVDFDPGPGTNALTSAGGVDNFVARYSPAGLLQWAIRFGGTGADIPHAVVVDSTGSAYLTGYFAGSVDFDPSAGTTTLTSSGGRDVYVAKFNSTGALQWAFGFGGTADDEGFDLALDPTGQVLVTGQFAGAMRPNPSNSATVLTAEGTSDAFLAKYTSGGQYVWASRIGGPLADVGYAVESDSTSNVLLTAGVYGTVDMDPGPLASLVTSRGESDIAVAKYNTSGAHVWSFAVGDTGLDLPSPGGLLVDASGNVVVTGSFRGQVDFDPAPAVAATRTSNGGSDIFLARYSSSGAHLSSIAIGGTGQDGGESLALHPGGDLYIGGWFADSVDFDPGAGLRVLTGHGTGGATDAFVARYTNAGAFVWADGWGGAVSGAIDELNTAVSGLGVDSNGAIAAVGRFYGSIDADPSASTLTLTSAGASDAFLIKLEASGVLWRF